MNLKDLLLCMLIILIPLLLLYLCNKELIKDHCEYNLKCIKDELSNNLKNFNTTYKKNESFSKNEKEDKEELIEGFFDGITSWFSGSSPSTVPGAAPGTITSSALPNVASGSIPTNFNSMNSPMNLPLKPPTIHQNIDESLDLLNKKSTLVSKKFPPDENDSLKNILPNNGIPLPSQDDLLNNNESVNNDNKEIIKKSLENISKKKSMSISTDNELTKANKKVKDNLLDMQNNVENMQNVPNTQGSSNMSNLLGTCQFYNEKCPDDYTSFGNFSIEGVSSNLTLNCGNIKKTKPGKAVAQIKNNSLYEIFIIDKGEGYLPNKPPKITIEGGKGNGATAECIVDDEGFLKIIKIVNPGYNYSESPNVLIEPPLNDSSCHFCCKK
jgi:hypothetical protein